MMVHSDPGTDGRPATRNLSDLPDRLRSIEAEPRFVDREVEFGALERAWRATSGGLGFALIGGEPGIGKTRLATQLARALDDRGARVLYGRNDAELAVPVQPFAEALGELVATSPANLEALGDAALPLARVVPAIRNQIGFAANSPPERHEQYELFHSVSSLLSIASREEPILLIVDDIHWADRPTALLLRYLCTTVEPIRGMIVATYRTTDVEPESAVGGALAELKRMPNVADLVLGGLPRDGSIALAASVAGHDLAEHEVSLAEMVHAETGGNPLFCTQLLRSLGESGVIGRVAGRWEIRQRVESIDLSGTITEILRSRVDRLGEEAAEILAAAAVIGPEFTPTLVEQVADREPAVVCRALDLGLDAGIVTSGVGEQRFQFVHPLFSRVLYETTGPASRGPVHRRAALALEKALGRRADDHAAELARHWLAASPPDPEQAAVWAMRAGKAALEKFEGDAAARWYQQALDLAPNDARERRCELLIGLGKAQRDCGDPDYRETLLTAARLAAEIDDDERLTVAALSNTRAFPSAPGAIDEERIAILDLALKRAGDSRSDDRARLLAALAAELSFSREWDRRVELSDAALEIARGNENRRVLCDVLIARFVTIWMPETLPERLTNSEENVVLADQAGSPREQFAALHWRSVALVQPGQISEAVDAIDRERNLARKLGDPTALWLSTYDRGSLAVIAGRLGEAESLANEAYRIAVDSAQPDAFSFFASQISNVRYEQGRLPELQELLARVVADEGIPAFRAVLALAYVESGLPAEARRLLLLEAETRFEELPRDVSWLTAHVIYAHVSAELGENGPAELLYERLSPFAEQIVHTGISSWGCCEHALGRLACTLGDLDRAEGHLESARTRYRGIGAPAWAVRGTLDLSRSLLRRGTLEGARRAVALLDAAGEDARGLGIASLVTQVDNLRSHAQAKSVIGSSNGVAARLRLQSEPVDGSAAAVAGDSTETAAADEPPGEHGVLCCEGDTWSISHPGGKLRLRDAKGVRYLATLLAQPGVEHHAVDLQSGPAAVGGASSAEAAELSIRAAGDGDAGAVLDDQAKRAYRERIEHLRDEIEEAESFNDPHRASRAREELEYLGRELAAAVGIGGRDRRAASSAERARVNVTRAIRKVVQRVAELDGQLGDHLRHSVRTGAFCVYEPGSGEAIAWKIANSASGERRSPEMNA